MKLLGNYKKYLFFVVFSFIFAFLVCVSVDLFAQDMFVWKRVIQSTFVCWGFCYIFAFFIYERRKKNIKKE